MDAAEVIRNAREQAGLSKRELARRAGTSAAALVEYETGRRDPGLRSLQRILAAAGFEATLVAQPSVGPLAPGPGAGSPRCSNSPSICRTARPLAE